MIALLHQQGIHPRLDYLEGGNRLRSCRDVDDCLRKVAWSLGELTPAEQDRLRAYYEENAGRIGRQAMRWALVSWDVPSGAGR